MKKILAVAVALIMVLALVPAFALADTTVTTESKFLEEMAVGGDIKLGDDITVDNSSLSAYTKSVTLDLNGHTLSFEKSALTFSGPGVNFILKDTDPEGGGLLDFADVEEYYYVNIANHATMTLMSGTISAFWYGIAAWTYATVNVTGGAIYTTDAGSGCISGNGSAGSGNTVINISGGVLEAQYGVETKHVESVAIYHPQSGDLNISGGTLKGGTGICMLAGTLNMTGGTVIGTSSGDALTNTNDGTKGNGSAICLVSNPAYAGNINVIVSGGTLTSDSTDAIAEFRYDSTLPQNLNTGNYVTTQVQGVIVNNKNGTKINVPEGKKALNNGFDEGVATVAAYVVINDEAGSEVRANASPTFTIIIPELVDFGELTNNGDTLVQPFNVALTNALLEPDAQVEVSVVSDFKMDNGGDGTRAYTLTNGANTLAETGEIYVTFTGNRIDKGIAACVDTITQAGAYTDTMVFSVFYRPSGN